MTISSFYDRVRFSSTTAGTGPLGVGTAMQGYKTPAQAGMADGTVGSWVAESSDHAQVECFQGVFVGGTITRVTVFSRSTGFSGNFTVPPPDVRLESLANDLTFIVPASTLDGSEIVFLRQGGNNRITTLGALAAFFGTTTGGPGGTTSSFELREDGSFELREDGSFELRE